MAFLINKFSDTSLAVWECGQLKEALDLGKEASARLSHLRESNFMLPMGYVMVINNYEFPLSLSLPDTDLKSLGLNF